MDAPQEIPFYVGHLLPQSHGVITHDEVDAALDSKYDMVAGYITNGAFRSRVEKTIADARAAGKEYIQVKYLEESEANLHPGDHIGQIVAFTSPWIELDSSDPLVASASKQVLKHEMAYAAFVGINNVVITGPKSTGIIAQYAQSISTVLATSMYMQVHIQLPIVEEEAGATTTEGSSDPYSSWDMWNTIRSICKYNLRLSLALRLPLKLPRLEVQARWLCEPVRFLSLSSSIFLPNNKGYPVLSKHHQQLITRYTKMRPVPYFLLSDTNRDKAIPASMTASQTSAKNVKPADPSSYLAYIRHIQKNQLPVTVLERAGVGYQDYLQSPLQPLADNLESSTYEVFEKDPVKYDQYEKAIELALWERDPKSTINVAVVGAGRGPLVSRALSAAKSAGRDIKLTAVEKNPNAYVTLLRHNRETWGGRVTVIKSDMRSWNPDFKVDILISELLGSFGDNELSPECLDGVQRVLSLDGITIPTSYSAHFTPIMAPKLHADITNRFTSEPTAAETPYVVYLHAVELLAQDKYIHNAWEFTHPIPADAFEDIRIMHEKGIVEGSNEHNTRFSKHTFKIPTRGVIHGLGGYFESVLYGDVELSIRPDTIEAKSKDMTSWFPMFFPIKTPLPVPDLSEVDISIWRLTDDKKVWYDWIVETYTVLDDTKRSRLGVSDLHSSKKVACLM